LRKSQGSLTQKRCIWSPIATYCHGVGGPLCGNDRPNYSQRPGISLFAGIAAPNISPNAPKHLAFAAYYCCPLAIYLPANRRKISTNKDIAPDYLDNLGVWEMSRAAGRGPRAAGRGQQRTAGLLLEPRAAGSSEPRAAANRGPAPRAAGLGQQRGAGLLLGLRLSWTGLGPPDSIAGLGRVCSGRLLGLGPRGARRGGRWRLGRCRWWALALLAAGASNSASGREAGGRAARRGPAALGEQVSRLTRGSRAEHVAALGGQASRALRGRHQPSPKRKTRDHVAGRLSRRS
jgi:hypothetical protein